VSRVRAFGYAALVSAVVFYYLAAPMLEAMFGPEVVLTAYAAAALLAGALTYRAVRVTARLAAREERRATDDEGPPTRVDGEDLDVDADDRDIVEAELETLAAEEE